MFCRPMSGYRTGRPGLDRRAEVVAAVDAWLLQIGPDCRQVFGAEHFGKRDGSPRGQWALGWLPGEQGVILQATEAGAA